LQQGHKLPFVLRQREGNQWITIPCPALVDAKMWEQCNARLIANRGTGGNPERTHLLTSLLRCPYCGRGMRGYRRERRGKLEHFYHCPDQRASRNAAKVVCNPVVYPAASVEELVMDKIREAAQHPELIVTALRAYFEVPSRGDDKEE